VLEAVQLPARVSGLDARLADVDGDHFTENNKRMWRKGEALKMQVDFAQCVQQIH
jgi:hypothetical protein